MAWYPDRVFSVALSLGGLLVRVAALAVIPRVIARLSPAPKAEVAPEITLESRGEDAPAVVKPVLKARQVASPRWKKLALKPTESPSLPAWGSPDGARAPPFAGTKTRSRAYLHRRSYPINASDPMGLEPHRGEDAPIEGVPNWGHVVRQATMDAKHRALQDGEYTAKVIDNHKVDIVLALTPEGWVEETVSAAGRLLAYFRRAKAATATVKMYSRINESGRLIRYAEQATTNKAVQVEMDALFLQLSRGNMNPGSGTKFLFNGVYKARSAGGARLYFRNSPFGVEILGKSSKANQSQVINTLREMYGK